MRTPKTYAVTVLGGTSISIDDVAIALSAAKRQMLAALVAAGPQGLTSASLGKAAQVKSESASAVRMAVARLRDLLPPDGLPPSVDGRYRLCLPTDSVDVWHLEAMAALPPAEIEAGPKIAHVLAPLEPFGGIAGTTLIDDAASRVVTLRSSLVSSIIESRPEILGPEFSQSIVALCESDAYNEGLLLRCARLLAETGSRREALALIRQGRDSMGEIGLSLSQELESLEGLVLDGEIEIRSSVQPSPRIPDRLLEELESAYISGAERSGEIKGVMSRHRTGVSTAIIRGRAGVGKTRLIAEIAERSRQRRWPVIYAGPSGPGADGAMGCLIAAIPELRSDVDRIVASELDHESRQLELWTVVRIHIERLGTGTTLVLLVDDLHWADSMTIEFLNHFTTVISRASILLILCGRSDGEARAHWAGLELAALRCGATSIDVAELSSAEMTQFVMMRRPELRRAQAFRLADEIHTRSGGLPAIARSLLALCDEHGLFELGRSSGALDPGILKRLPGLALTVGAASAVLGSSFELDDLMTVTGLEQEEVLKGIDILIRHDLVVERSPSAFRERHALVGAAFIDAVDRSVLRQFHRRAFEIAGSAHRRARHAAGAGPSIDNSTVVEHLLTSASEYVQSGLLSEAISEYREIERRSDHPIPLRHQVPYTRALDLIGAHEQAMDMRRAGIDSIEPANRDWALGLRLVVSGLPESEPIDGSDELVELIRRIPTAELTDSELALWTRHLARQLSIAGRHEEARRCLQKLTPAGSSERERLETAFATHAVLRGRSHASERLAMLEAVRPDVDQNDAVRAEWCILASLDHLESGRLSAARVVAQEILTMRDAPILRQWHAQMVETVALAELGEGERAAKQRQATFEFGALAGVRESEHAFLISDFIEMLLNGTASTLAPLVEDGGIDPAENILMRAGVASVLEEADQPETAREHAEIVARDPASATWLGVSALALSARSLARSKELDLIQYSKRRLLDQGDAMIVVGAGAACLGPARRYAAHLEHDWSTRRELLASAVSFADATGFHRWAQAARQDAGSRP